MESVRLCAECGQTLQGRSDKRFCDDQCRSQFNNRQGSECKNLYRRVEYALRRNHLILQALNPASTAVVRLQQLLHQGFDFEYLTSQLQNQAGHTYFYVYDQGYRFLEDDQVLLVVKKPDEPLVPLQRLLRKTG